MSFKGIFDLLTPGAEFKEKDGIIDLVPDNCPYEDVGAAYDKSLVIYDDYMAGNKLHLRVMKKILLGMGKEDTDICLRLTRRIAASAAGGVMLEIPVGTGYFTIETYAKNPQTTFVCADLSRGMLRSAKSKADNFGAKNVIFVRADVEALPFKNDVFDGVLTLNGIHSFPNKEKALAEMIRVLKPGKEIQGSLVLRKERWLTDLAMELFYFPGKWFCRPALKREEFLSILDKHGLTGVAHSIMRPALIFEGAKKRAAFPDTSSPARLT